MWHCNQQCGMMPLSTAHNVVAYDTQNKIMLKASAITCIQWGTVPQTATLTTLIGE